MFLFQSCHGATFPTPTRNTDDAIRDDAKHSTLPCSLLNPQCHESADSTAYLSQGEDAGEPQILLKWHRVSRARSSQCWPCMPGTLPWRKPRKKSLKLAGLCHVITCNIAPAEKQGGAHWLRLREEVDDGLHWEGAKDACLEPRGAASRFSNMFLLLLVGGRNWSVLVRATVHCNLRTHTTK